MGRVFLAEDPLIDRKVAIKVMSSEGNAEAHERFRNEARTAGQLAHPNIVQLHEFGFHQGQPYLVMEYLVGEGLDRWLTRPQPFKARLSILLDLCHAIGHAHSRGVLHRDVKPSNLQVLPDGTCKLMDFGIARSQAAHLTATGMILGTPEFIAPEVLRDAGYSTRSDLFAVALVVYETLSGFNPFHAKTLEGCLTQVLTHEPPPLSESSAEVSAELSDVVASYLCKDPEGRPEDVLPLVAALRSLQERTLRLGDDVRSLAGPPPADPILCSQEGTAEVATGNPVPSTGSRRRLAPAVVVVAGLAVVITVLLWRPWSGSAVPTEEVVVAPMTPPAAAPDEAPALVTDLAQDETGMDPAQPPSEVPQAPPQAVKESPSEGAPVISDPEPVVPRTSRPSRPTVRDSVAQRAAPRAAESLTPPATQEEPAQLETREDLKDSPKELPSRREPQTDETTEESSGLTAPTPAPKIHRLEPMVVRRGSSTALRITGEGFGPKTKAVIRRGGRPIHALRILGRKIDSPTALHFTLLVDRQLPLGTYAVTVVDGAGRESNSLTLEVGL